MSSFYVVEDDGISLDDVAHDEEIISPQVATAYNPASSSASRNFKAVGWLISAARRLSISSEKKGCTEAKSFARIPQDSFILVEDDQDGPPSPLLSDSAASLDSQYIFDSQPVPDIQFSRSPSLDDGRITTDLISLPSYRYKETDTYSVYKKNNKHRSSRDAVRYKSRRKRYDEADYSVDADHGKGRRKKRRPSRKGLEKHIEEGGDATPRRRKHRSHQPQKDSVTPSENSGKVQSGSKRSKNKKKSSHDRVPTESQQSISNPKVHPRKKSLRRNLLQKDDAQPGSSLDYDAENISIKSKGGRESASSDLYNSNVPGRTYDSLSRDHLKQERKALKESPENLSNLSNPATNLQCSAETSGYSAMTTLRDRFRNMSVVNTFSTQKVDIEEVIKELEDKGSDTIRIHTSNRPHSRPDSALIMRRDFDSTQNNGVSNMYL